MIRVIAHSSSNTASATAEHIAATADEAAKVREGMVIVRVLDGIVKNRYANDPGKLAAWISASHVEKAPKKKGPNESVESMKVATLLLLLITVFLIAPVFAQKKKSVAKPKPKPTPTRKTDITVERSDGNTLVGTPVLPGMANGRQGLAFQLLFSSEKPDETTLIVSSVSSDYLYADGAYVNVLVDGSSLVGTNYKAARSADSGSNGMAIERMYIPLSTLQVLLLANSSRVDIIVNWYMKFTVSAASKASIRRFLDTIEPIVGEARHQREEETANRKKAEEAQKIRDAEQKKIFDAEEKERNTCRLSQSKAPRVRGLQLGMSISDVNSIVPIQYFALDRQRLAIGIDAFGTRKFIWNAEERGIYSGRPAISFRKPGCSVDSYWVDPADSVFKMKFGSALPTSLEGVWNMRLLVRENQLVGFYVSYLPHLLGIKDERGMMKSGAFQQMLLTDSILPKEWSGSKLLDFAACDGFYVDVDDFHPSIAVVDTNALDSAVSACFPEISQPKPTIRP